MNFATIRRLDAALTDSIDKINSYHLEKFHVDSFIIHQRQETSDFVAGSHPVVGFEFEGSEKRSDFSLNERGPKFGGIIGYFGILVKQNANFTEVLSTLTRHNHFAAVPQVQELLDQRGLDRFNLELFFHIVVFNQYSQVLDKDFKVRFQI